MGQDNLTYLSALFTNRQTLVLAHSREQFTLTPPTPPVDVNRLGRCPPSTHPGSAIEPCWITTEAMRIAQSTPTAWLQSAAAFHCSPLGVCPNPSAKFLHLCS